MRILRTATLAHRADQYADKREPATEDTFEIPEDLTQLSDEEIVELHNKATEAFNGIYGDGSELSDDDLVTLSALTEGIEGVKEELATRETAAAERRERAAELAAKVNPADESDEDDEEGAESDDEDDDEAEDAESDSDDAEAPSGDAEEDDDESAAQTVTASAPKRRRGPVRVDMSQARRHLPKARTEEPRGMRDVVFAAGEGSGYSAGEGIDFADAGKIVDRRLAAINDGTVRAAARAGRGYKQQMGVMSIRKPIPDDLVIGNNDAAHVEETLRRAASENRLQGNSLVAAGGWCAPSETLYDLLELESRDGIFSLPEVGIARGGISRTLGPNFADIYNAITGFHYTEDQDIAGQYGVDENGDGNDTDGTKPCYKVDCPDFEEFRLELDGLCITAGLLQQRGYPEVIARTIRGALIAHDHRLAARTLRSVQAGSTAVTMPTEAGAAAPVLTAIELQVEHLRYTQRIARSATIEAIFPFWVRGALRSDLSKRTGVDLLNVSDAQINAWFTARGISPQFVYNFQDINVLGADEFTGWPNEVTFLMYPAGSWIRGSSDVITMDTLVDSSLVRTNDYTALFTEEGWMVVPMGHDSRAVTVPIDADGSTAIGVDLATRSVDLTPAAPGE